MLQKRKRKDDWQDAKAVAEGIAEASVERQAQWLWDSYAASTDSTDLERAGLEGARKILSLVLEANSVCSNTYDYPMLP